MSNPESVLVIVTRRLGDVLLATPLIRSLRLAWPAAAIDALVFSGTEGILEANSDIRKVIPVLENAKDRSHLKILLSLARKYDLAVSTLPGDRPTFYAWLAGTRRIGFVLNGTKHLWKHFLLSRGVPFDDINTHTVLMNLVLADMLGIKKNYNVVVSWGEKDQEAVEHLLPQIGSRHFAVLHMFPKYRYKMWNPEGWPIIAKWLAEQGMGIVLTGSGDAKEMEYNRTIERKMPSETKNLCGRLTLGAVGFLLSKAAVYVGPDTVVTHMAAALGVPTVALFGPTNPVKWGPWPRGYAKEINPYSMRGCQQVDNVVLLQGPGDCVPCREEGCRRNINSESECLLRLAPAQVIEAMSIVMSSVKPCHG